ncbi:DUF4271 domain-containing protein [Niabella aurantiaca]|uniref:DUF4271 domain-containing protein n=1 Tax=Niabella aurantiaca TaxID=379900 RepID=UPI001FDF1C03|nr:DUF4271 domain-containing protein [Niabella aurantiaca]
MSTLSAQKKDSAKDQPQTRSASKTDTNRKNTLAQPASKKQSAAGKKSTTPVKPATDKAKATRQPAVSGNKKTAPQKDTVKKKDTVAKPVVKPVTKKDSATAKKAGAQAGLKQDSAGRTGQQSPVKKDTVTRPATAVAVHARPHLPDSTRIKAAIADSLKEQARGTKLERDFARTQQILAGHPYYAFSAQPIITPYSKRHKQTGEEIYFYTLAGIMLLFAGFKTAFAKYFEDLITLFFRRTLKQRQLQQQLSQNTLPSFLFNILFVFTAGYYLALMAEQLAGNEQAYPFWQLFSFAAIFVSFAYLAKFFLLKLFGWLFKLQHLTDAYIFLIFLVNKILVLFLLPVIVVTSLGGTGIKTIIWTLSWLIIGALFLYRFTVAVQMVQKSNKVSLFHFSIYFIAFELLPAFVIYKFILHFLTGNSVPLHTI